jgi:tetratricopeptide (TPR) repeat protein
MDGMASASMRHISSALFGVAMITGCARAPQPAGGQGRAQEVRRPPAPRPGPMGVLSPDESRELCLADPGGSGREARRFRTAQAAARKRGQPDDWVRAGGEWVRQARRSSDPGFYLNSDGCAATALVLEPEHAAALDLRGLALLNQHRFAEAQALAERILKRAPQDIAALGLASDALLELGRYDEAAAAAQRQMSILPGMAARARGSYLRWLEGDTRRAKLLVRDALAGRNPADPEPAAWTFVEAATIFWHEADYAGADAIYVEALRWVLDYPAALVGRARVAMAQKQPRIAIPYLQKAHAARPLVETAWLLGDAQAMAGDSGAAELTYDEALREGRRGDRLGLAYLCAVKNRNIEEAMRAIEEERQHRGGVYVDDVYAWVLYRSGRLAEARQASDRARRLGTRDARLFYHAGAIRIAAGDKDRGRVLVQRALALNPGFDWTGAAEAQALVEGPAAKRSSS